MKDRGYHKLIIWQKGKVLLKLIYQKTESFPHSEQFGLQSQLRRAILSVLLNIVEGHRRNTTKDFLKFLNIADASLVEVEACIEIALDLRFITQKDFDELEKLRDELAIILQSFVRSVSKRV